MSKSIYEEAFEDLERLIEQANARKLSNEIVANRWGIERITNIIKQAEKQEKLLELYKQLNKLYQELYTIELSQLVLNQNYYEIEIIKLKQRIKELEK